MHNQFVIFTFIKPDLVGEIGAAVNFRADSQYMSSCSDCNSNDIDPSEARVRDY